MVKNMKLSNFRTLKNTIKEEIKNDSDKLAILKQIQSISKDENIVFVCGFLKKRVNK